MKRAFARGVTLIELMVALALGFILVMLAIPSYNTWTADAEVSGAASALADALRAASAEAIKQNTSVEFILSPPGWTARYAGHGPSHSSGSVSGGRVPGERWSPPLAARRPSPSMRWAASSS